MSFLRLRRFIILPAALPATGNAAARNENYKAAALKAFQAYELERLKHYHKEAFRIGVTPEMEKQYLKALGCEQ